MNKKEMLITEGSHLKTSNLIEQAAYTLELAANDFNILSEYGLSQDQLKDAESLKNEIAELKGKQESTKDNIPLSTEDIFEVLTDAKEWLKKSKLKAKRVFRLNKTTLGDFLNLPVTGRSVPNTIAALVKAIELQKKYNNELSAAGGGSNFADEGAALLKNLQDMDAKQEIAKTNLPEASRELYYKQGQLYMIMKDINDIAHEAFIQDRTKSAKYSMSILKRRGTKKEAAEAVVK